MTSPGMGGGVPDALETDAGALAPPAGERRSGRLRSIPWWIVFLLGFLYFFVPLLGTFTFSMRSQPLFSAYAVVTDDPQFSASLFYSFLIGILTIVVSTVLIVP